VLRTYYLPLNSAGKQVNDLGIACLAGTAFGAGGEGYLRFSYASSMEKIQEMIGILKKEYGTK